MILTFIVENKTSLGQRIAKAGLDWKINDGEELAAYFVDYRYFLASLLAFLACQGRPSSTLEIFALIAPLGESIVK